ncbi:MAG: thioredoxin family protein [Nitrospirota bacterium]
MNYPSKPGPPVTDANEENFNSLVTNSPLPVVLEFWSPECGFCMKMAKVVDALASELSERYRVVKMNILENPYTPNNFGVNGIPAFFRIEDGKIIGKAQGAMSKGRLKKELGIL